MDVYGSDSDVYDFVGNLYLNMANLRGRVPKTVNHAMNHPCEILGNPPNRGVRNGDVTGLFGTQLHTFSPTRYTSARESCTFVSEPCISMVEPYGVRP